MDFLIRVLFEDLLLLLLASVVAVAVALGIHRRRYTARSRRGVWATLAVCGVLLVVQHLVDTDRERLIHLVEEMVEAVDAGDVGGVARHVDDQGITLGQRANAIEFSKAVFVQGTHLGLQQYQVDEAGAGGFEIEVTGDEAIVSFRVSCDVSSSRGLVGRFPSMWTIGCVRRADGWRMNRILEGELGVQQFGAARPILGSLQNMCNRALAHLER